MGRGSVCPPGVPGDSTALFWWHQPQALLTLEGALGAEVSPGLDPSHMDSEARKGPGPWATAVPLPHPELSGRWPLAELGWAPRSGPGLVSAYPGLMPQIPVRTPCSALVLPGAKEARQGFCSRSSPALWELRRCGL